MANSFTQIYLHIIFRIKNQETLIREEDSSRLYTYILGIIKNNDGIPIIMDGYKDHVHILCTISKNITVAKLLQEIKQHSSRFLKTVDDYYRCFEWQSGYAVFSVSPSKIEKTKNYISNQKEHHKRRNFMEEYKIFLKEYGIDFDEKYL